MRRLMWFAIGFCVACVWGVYFNVKISLWILIGLFLGAMALLYFCRRRGILRVVGMLALSFAVGMGWFSFYDNVYLGTLRQLDGTTQEYTVEISDFSYETGRGCASSGWVIVENKPCQVLLYFNDYLQLSPGDKISGSFYFRFTAQGGREEPTYHRSEGIFLLASQRGEVSHIPTENPPIYVYPALWRKTLCDRIDQMFPADTAAFAKALLLGNRSGIDYQTNTAFKVTGISHVIAVSGLHVSVLFSLIYVLTARKRVLLFLLGIPVLVLFAAITGFTPSVTRACIMQALMLLALLTDKAYDPPTALGFAALVMLLVNPMVIVSVSFQLSVGCMVGIFLFYENISDWFFKRRLFRGRTGMDLPAKLSRWFVCSVSISISVWIVTTPLVAYHFETVSLISILTNLLLVWLITYIFYGIMLCCALSVISLLFGKILAWAVTLPIRLVLGTAVLLSKFPFAAVYTQSKYIVVWLITVYLLLAVFLCMKNKRPFLLSCLAGIGLCAALLASWTEPLLDECRLTVLDVGQGQCILFQSGGKTFLVDCGGDSITASADLAAQTIHSQGIFKLDGIIITHYDTDHAGALPALLTRVRADHIYLPYLLDVQGIGVEIRNMAGSSAITVYEDLVLQAGDVTVSLFAPESYSLENECSICVLFQTENCDILITGDRGVLGEQLLMHRVQLPELEVLVAGHHGSAGSTGERLLEQTKPQYVLISAGEDNRYGHPAKSLLERLSAYDCEIYRTDKDGTIIYRR